MKRLLTHFTAIIITINLFGQAPQKMSYQAVIRNTSNALVTNSPVKMRISILQGSNPGTSVYSELHSATTNANGLVSIEIGEGTNKTGTFSSINWGNGTYFLKTETDPNNGTNYSIVGTSQLLSVPYALESNNAGNGIKEVSKTGDTVYLDNGKKYIIPGIKDISPASTINNGLIAYYPFNGNANDESGNNNNATVNGATLTNDRFGNSNKAYSFDGIDDRIEREITNNFPIGNTPRTISVWYKINGEFNINRLGSNYNAAGSVVEFGKFSTSNRFGLLITKEYYPYCVTQNNDFWVQISTQLQKWQHIILIASGNRCDFYLNGVFFGGGALGEPINTINGRLSIGNTINDPLGNGQNEAFNGLIDDVRIYNRALTQEEITYLYNN
jgi:hypothetical protein